jgi:hypothetical protein
VVGGDVQRILYIVLLVAVQRWQHWKLKSVLRRISFVNFRFGTTLELVGAM